MGLVTIGGKTGKILQQASVHFHLKSGHAPQFEVSVNRFFQHREPPVSGHG
jgi:hypothetical protein